MPTMLTLRLLLSGLSRPRPLPEALERPGGPLDDGELHRGASPVGESGWAVSEEAQACLSDPVTLRPSHGHLRLRQVCSGKPLLDRRPGERTGTSCHRGWAPPVLGGAGRHGTPRPAGARGQLGSEKEWGGLGQRPPALVIAWLMMSMI